MAPRAPRRPLMASLVSTVLAVSGLSVVLAAATAPAASAATPTPVCNDDGRCTLTFGYSGAVESWTVPPGVTSVTATVEGAAGGQFLADLSRYTGLGGRSVGTFAVASGEVISILVGGAGGFDGFSTRASAGSPGGFGGGGQGGATSDIGSAGAGGGGGSAVARSNALLLVAGGGGGSYSSTGGAGGGATAAATAGVSGGFYPVVGVQSGGAGTASSGGAGGAGLVDPSWSFGGPATAGKDGTGPASASPLRLGQGGRGGLAVASPGGGGGGGYYGGGGGGGFNIGGASSDAAGGGGSGYAAPSVTGVSGAAGVRRGNGQVVLTYSVPLIPQAITFVSQTPSSPSLGSFYDVAATGGGSGNPVLFSVGGTPTGACTISGSRVTFVHAGTCVISADQARGNGYAAAPTASQTVTVPKVDQTITFVAPNDAKVGGSTLLAPTGGGSGNPVVIEATQSTSTTNGCTVNGSTVTYVRATFCALTISQAGSADYNPATTVLASFLIGKGAQTITGLTLPGSPRVGDTAVLAATGGGSSQAISYATTSTACAVTGSTVSFVHVGTCAVTASQGADADYTAATDVSASTTVAKKLQTISFSLPTAPKVGDDAALTATASSGGPVSYTAGGDPGVCRIAGGKVVYDHVGTCTVTASQAGTDDVAAAPEVSQSVSVGQGLQSISFAISGLTRVGDSRTLSATGGASGNPITYAVGGGTTDQACVIRAGKVVFEHTGTCVVTADQAGDADYEAAATATQTLTILPGFADLVRSGATAGAVGDLLDVTWTTASSAPVVITVRDATKCTVVGTKVRLDHVSLCVVRLQQDATADHLAADVQYAIDVSRATQAITGFAPGASGTVGGSVDLSATGGASGNAVTFAVSADTTDGACTLSGVRLTFVHAGACVVTADQAGSTDYLAAPQQKLTIAVGRAAQAITGFQLPGSAPIGFQAVLTATGGPGGATVVFAIGAGTTPGACRIVAGAVVTEHAGTCVVTADQAGGADFEPATQVVQTFAVVRNTQSLRFTLPASAALGGTAALAATGGVGGSSLRFAVDPATTNDACVIDGSTVRFVHGGTCVVAASDPGDADTDPARALASTVVQRAATVTSVSVTGTGLRALVRSDDSSLGTPTGEVQFLLDGVLVGTARLDAAGTAVLELVVPNGEHQVVARYLGDGDFAAGVGDYATSSGEVVRTDPVITAAVTSTRRISASGWYRRPVTVTFTCVPGSGALVGDCPSPVVISRSTKGRAVTRTILAQDGGSATVTTESLRVDLKKPKVRVKGIAAGKPRCVAKDRVSGVASCRLKVRERGGRTVYVAIAKDVAGNTARVRKVSRR